MTPDRAKEMKSSFLWAETVEEIDKKLHYETQRLRTCKPEELLLIQAKIQVYESIKRLPDDVIDRES